MKPEDLAIVRRPSGGGAVLVALAQQVWLDVFVPRDDPLFRDDIHVGAHWIGELWQAALKDAAHPKEPVHVHRGAVVANSWSRSICFASLGPVEVTIGDRKVVGVSQRRIKRQGAWFFSMALVAFDAAHLARRIMAPAIPDEGAFLAASHTQIAAAEVESDVLEASLRHLLTN